MYRFIPNTAVFGPTKLIETTIASTARMKILDEDFGWRFLRWPDGAIRKFLFIYLFCVNDFGWRFLRWPDGAIRKILFIYLFKKKKIFI